MANIGTIIRSGEIKKEFIATSGEVRTCFGYGGEIRNCPLWGLYQKQMVSMSWNGRKPHKYADNKLVGVKILSVDRYLMVAKLETLWISKFWTLPGYHGN